MLNYLSHWDGHSISESRKRRKNCRLLIKKAISAEDARQAIKELVKEEKRRGAKFKEY